MLQVGQKAPDPVLWAAPGERRTLVELVAAGRALFVFYLFDWSST